MQILPLSSSTKSNLNAGGYQQTQLGTGYGLPLAHKELIRPLTSFAFNPVGCPHHTPTLLSRKPGGGEGLIPDNLTMKQVSSGLHGTVTSCRSDNTLYLTIQSDWLRIPILGISHRGNGNVFCCKYSPVNTYLFVIAKTSLKLS